MESVFFQRIICNDNEVPVQLLLHGTYIEAKDLSGPKVILKFADRDSGIKDTLGVNEGALLSIDFGDIHVEDGSTFSESFCIVSAKEPDENVLVIEAMQSHMNDLKQPSPPLFFKEKTPRFILQHLFPHIKERDIHMSGINGRGTYHIHHAITASAILKQMAKDFGAKLFYCRGQLFMYSLSQIKQAEERLTYEHRNAIAEKEAWKLKLSTSDTMLKRNNTQVEIGWSETEGVISAGGNANRFAAHGNSTFLQNQRRFLLPLCQFEVTGTTELHPKDNIKVIFNRTNQDAMVDESIPDLMSIVSISHFQKGSHVYKCLVVTGEVHES